jgi:hypothetical protein
VSCSRRDGSADDAARRVTPAVRDPGTQPPSSPLNAFFCGLLERSKMRWQRRIGIVAAAFVLGPVATAGASERAEMARVVLAAPAPDLAVPMRMRAPLPEAQGDAVWVLATDFNAPIFDSWRRDTWGLGALRRGTIVAGQPRAYAGGCPGGQWLALDAGGLVCTKDGVEIVESPRTPEELTLAPDLSAPLPFRYAKVVGEAAPRFDRVPTLEEERAVDEGRAPSGLGVTRTEGIYFMAVEGPVDRDGQVFWRSVEGELVREEDLSLVSTPRFRGEDLVEEALPLAFVNTTTAEAFDLRDGAMLAVGRAERGARFVVAGDEIVDGQVYVFALDGMAVRREDVRMVTRIGRPAGVRADDRWVHVDLDEQTLVAYEGDRPVRATLVSTGAPGYETPTGLYRVRRKYVSRRMRGPDPDHGTYDIEEVPWILYYNRGYALHGAYWHDEFGNVRSHGCTNIPPTDAAWLFDWSDPEVPEGWHGIHKAGTHVYVTRG